MYSVRIEPTKLIFVGKRITYQATGDAMFLYMPGIYYLITTPSGNMMIICILMFNENCLHVWHVWGENVM